MYRNCYYNSYTSSVFLRTWSEEGVRIDTEMPFSPYLYVEDEKGNCATSIFKTPLKRKNFQNSFERNKFVKESGKKRFFGNLPPEQQFLIDMYHESVHDKDFSKFPLKVYYFDIETYSPDSFPLPKEAKDPVILITVYNSLNGQIDTWGVEKEYTPKQKNVKYHCCDSEVELFDRFMKFWKADPPDLWVGWNSEQFDIPYIINRGRKLLNDDFINQLSPLKSLRYREFRNDFGQETGKWIINGISCIDYMDLYKKFSKGDRESYSLNYIAEYELEEGKLAINATNLSSLAETNWENFVDYNIQDVNLLIKLDKKLNFLNIVRLLAYKGCTNFEAALGKIAIVTGAMSLQAREQGYVIPTFVNDEIRDSLAGGFVKDPVRGLHDGIVSFDVNSLYPNTIITLNISSETKLGKIITGDIEKDPRIQIKLVNGAVSSIETEKFKKFIKDEKVAVSKAGVLYSQKFKGVCPNLINKIYTERVEAKKKMKELQLSKKHDKSTKDSIVYYDTLQYTLKILLNSIYGVFANKHSPFMDIDNASSITLTGQAVAKAGSDIIRNFVTQKYGITDDVVIYNDTDSCYITIKPILQKYNIRLVDDSNHITQEAHVVVNEIDKIVNTEILAWARTELNSMDPRYEFKREAIADVGTFLQKKRYIIRVLDDEGIPTNKFKYVGVEIARSTTPKKVKDLIKKTVETAFLTKDVKKTNDTFREVYEEFKKLDEQEASFRKAVKDYEKYSKTTDLSKFEKGTPCHVKAAIAYNLLLKAFKIENKYEKINSGQKIKYFYAAKNRYNLDAVAFVAKFPDEFKEYIKIDYNKMFDKIVAAPIESVYEAINWRVPNFSKEIQTDLFDLLDE
jgi:DNA polymerase elongation subunit (family B)